MDNDIEELFQKKNKENEKSENNQFNYEECSLQNNTISTTFITTRGRVNNRAKPNGQKNISSDNGVMNNTKKENTQRLNAMKKCFKIVKNRNELNKIIMNSCKKVMSEDKTEKEQIQKDKIEINEKNFLSNTSNSFFKRNVDNFINNYLKNSFYVNENVNTLNNTEKTEESKEEYQIKNITVNKNSSLCSLISRHIKDNNKSNKIKEKKIIVDKNKKFKNNKSKIVEKLNIRKINTKKYINVNRMEQFKNKHINNHNNNSFSKIKNMFNSKKEELSKNKSFCEKNNLKNGIVNIKRNKLTSQRDSMSININDFDFRPLNDKNIHSNKFLKNNISLKMQFQNDGSNSIKINKRNNSNSTMVDKQKLKFRHSNPNNLINNANEFNRKNSINSENQKKLENKKNVNYMITSPTLYNTHIGFYFNSPNFAPFKKICINSPFNDNLTFNYNTLKEKINNLDNKYKTINVEKHNVNNNEEILKINQIYTKANDSKSIKHRKTKIIKRKPNSKCEVKDSKLHMNEDKFNTLEHNLNKNSIINNSFNYFAQITNRDDCTPYMFNHVETSGNNTTLEERKEKTIREHFFDNIGGLNNCGKKHLNLSNDIIISNNYKENNISKDIIFDVKNRTKKKENKRLKEKITINNKINKKEFNKKLEILTISKTKKTLYQPKPTNQELNKKIIDYKNKTSTHFFNSTVNNTINNNANNANNAKDNKTNYNYDSLKRAPKLLREKHYSDFNNSLFDKSLAASRKIISNKNLLNRINEKFKSPNDNQAKFGKKYNNNKYNTNSTNNNNVYKKPFSLTSARENNFDNFYNSTNNKNEKLQSNLKKTNNAIEKVSNFYGNKRNLNKDSIQNKKIYYETGSNNKNKNIKKLEKKKSKKSAIKEFSGILGLNNINLNNFKIQSKPFTGICKVKKYYHFAIQKDIPGICIINKERKISDKNDKYIYKKQFSSSAKKKHNSTKFDMEKINGGISQLMINYANNKEDNNKMMSQDDQSIKYNTYNFNDSINQINSLRGNSNFKINKNTIKNQLNTNTTSILEYKDLNKKLIIKDIKDNNTNINNNSLINYYDEESEVTFGRRDQIMLNNKYLSNKKKKSPPEKIASVNNNNNHIINNVFSYCNANEVENENNKELLDEESYVNGEVNYFNHTFHQSNQKCNNNSKIVYDFEINSITNNYYNNNNIILFSPQQKKLYFKYIEKGVGILSHIYSNHRINIFKSFAYFTFMQNNKNKSESVIYMKKKLKDNGGKKTEINLTPSAKKNSNFIDNNINQDILLNSLNKEKNLYENKMSNFMKKIGNIRTKSSDYIILEKKDKSLIRKIDIESDDFNDINNNIVKIDKIKKNESANNNPSYNTPRGFDKDEKNIVSPHFINNNEINVKRAENIKKTDFNEIFLEKNNLKMFHCTPKFCQIKPKFVDDLKLKEHLNDNIKKSYSLQEIFYIGSNSSLCFKENCLPNNFLSHCEEMMNYVNILEINKYDETDVHELNNNEKQNYSKYEILLALNKITELNFENVLDKLNYLMINDNNNQYTFIKIVINKVVKEKKYIILYAKLCCCLYNDILKIMNNYSNDEIDCNQNLGFDNDLKNILINECKMKFNSFINEINNNIIKDNTNDIKNQLYNFFVFMIELINMKLISFDNVFYYLEKLYKEYIDNNNGNNISILYLDEILYLLNIIMKNNKNIDNKNQAKLKKFLEEKIISIFENTDLLQINIKYKIINIKEKVKLFFENKINPFDIDFNQDDIEFCDGDIDKIITNILTNNKKIQNIKLLLLNDLQNFLKTKMGQLDNYNVEIIHNWYIIDEILFEIHIDLADFILYYLEISKEINFHYKEYQREYFENVLNYFIQYSLNDKKSSNQRILELLLNICWEKGEHNNESYFENIGYILLLLLNKNIISINDINYFINESDNIKQNISSIIKYTILIDNGNKGKYYKCFQNSNFFINNKELFNKIENLLKN